MEKATGMTNQIPSNGLRSWMGKFWDYRWQIGALALILVAIFKTNGGLMALRGIGRILIPLIIFYLGLRWVQTRLKRKFGAVFQKVMDAQAAAGGFSTQSHGATRGFPGSVRPNATASATLTACPHCGVYVQENHKCPKK